MLGKEICIMTKKMISLLLFCAMTLGMVGCGAPADTAAETTDSSHATAEPSTQAIPETTAPEIKPVQSNALDPEKSYNILFIGNSYTYYNSMPESLFAPIAKAAGYQNVKVTSITKGGWYLDRHANEKDEVGAQVDKALKENKYDYVVIQEQSACPAADPGRFYDGVRAIVEKIRANGATPVLYSTWGRKAGHKTLADYGWTNETMTWKLAAAYAAIGEELGIDVAYVGLAFHDIYMNQKGKLELYDEDSTHPSSLGSYLAAMTIFAEIFGVDPSNIEIKTTISDEAAALLREAARVAVFETPEIPAAYKTSSVGVKNEVTGYVVDDAQMINLKAQPTSGIISVLTGGTYPNGKSFSGLLGTKGAIASTEYSTTGLSDAQKADIADIGYGVSVIGIEKMDAEAKGYTTAVENLVNGHWGSSYMASFAFDDKKYTIDGTADDTAPYTGLITLNFGSKHKFDAVGFCSGSLKGFPGAAEVYVSDDGKRWTKVPTACWNAVTGTSLVSVGKEPKDPWNGNAPGVNCLFDMGGVSGQYIRIGVVIGRYDSADKYDTINTREVIVYGEKVE